MADILKAMSKPEVVHTGKYGYFSNPENTRAIPIHSPMYLQLIIYNYFTFMILSIIYLFPYFHLKLIFFLDPASQSTESLEQIAAFNVEELLSKSAVLSESMLLQLHQSLTRDWGEGFISTLPEDFVQSLLTEV